MAGASAVKWKLLEIILHNVSVNVNFIVHKRETSNALVVLGRIFVLDCFEDTPELHSPNSMLLCNYQCISASDFLFS